MKGFLYERNGEASHLASGRKQRMHPLGKVVALGEPISKFLILIQKFRVVWLKVTFLMG